MERLLARSCQDLCCRPRFLWAALLTLDGPSGEDDGGPLGPRQNGQLADCRGALPAILLCYFFILGSLYRLVFTSATTMAPAEKNDAYPGPQAAVVSNGVELHYIERGEGVPVIFIHGGLEDYTTWEDQARAFGESY